MSEISIQLENLSFKAQQLSDQASQLALAAVESSGGHSDFIIFGITLFEKVYLGINAGMFL